MSVYRYRHFTMRTLLEDMRFPADAPSPGAPFPDFDLPTTDGDRLRRADPVARRPTSIVAASFTGSMAAGAGPALRDLRDEYGDRVRFVTLYTREAHPGERIEQHEDLATGDGTPHPLRTGRTRGRGAEAHPGPGGTTSVT